MATFSLFNDIKRVVRSARLETESITTIFGDVKLDLTQTALERGDHRMRILTLFGDIKLRLSERIGLRIDAITLFSAVEVETLSRNTEEKPGGNWISENFDQAPVRVYLSIQGLFGDIEVLRLPTADTPAMDTLIPATKRDMSISMLRANLMTLLIGIPIALAQLSLFVVLRGALQVNVTMWGGMLFFAVLIVSVVAHELIHGLAWQVFGGASDASVSYGFQWRTLTPYAHISGPVEVNTYRIGGLMPGLVLGILPYLLSLALANVPLLVFSVIHTFAAGGDWLILWSLRTLPPGTRVEDHPSRAGCSIVDHEGKVRM